MKAKFNALVTMIVLIGLPLGSYLYLKKGFNYRKDALDEMKVERTVDLAKLDLLRAQSEEPLNDPTIILYAPVREENLSKVVEDMNHLHRQYGERSEVKFALAGSAALRPEIFNQVSEKLRNDLFISDQVSPDLNQANQLFLLDSEGGVRGTYNIEDLNEMKLLVKHISILLPLEKKKQIKLVRKKDTRDEEG